MALMAALKARQGMAKGMTKGMMRRTQMRRQVQRQQQQRRRRRRRRTRRRRLMIMTSRTRISKMMSVFWIGRGMPRTDSATTYLIGGVLSVLHVLYFTNLHILVIQKLYVVVT